MDIHYKIIKVFPEEHSIVVRFFTDVLTEEKLSVDPDITNKLSDGSPERCRTDYNINLPVPAPVDGELEKYIMLHAPVQWFIMHEQIADPNVDTSLSHIQPLINAKVTKTIGPESTSITLPTPTSMDTSGGAMSDDDIVNLLKKVAIDKSTK